MTQTSTEPRIAVLIPAYNEEPVIAKTIEALVEAGIAPEHLYVVDDRSTDRTAEICRQTGVNVYTVPVNGGKANAQKAALTHFKLLEVYQWLIFLDGDTKVDKNFVRSMIEAAAREPETALFLGQVKSVENSHIFSASRAYEYTYGQAIAKEGQDNFNVIFVAPGCSSMYRTDVLAKLHIDHMTLAEDMDLTMQVHRAGHRVRYVADAIVNTQDPSTLKDYHKQVLRWYRGYWQVIKKHGVFNLTKKKQGVDGYMMLVTLDAVLFNRIIWLALLVALYPAAVPAVIALELGVAGVIAGWSSYQTKRFDVLYKLPIYYWISYINFYAYIRSFFEIIVFKKELLAWNKVKRYNFEDQVAS